MEKQTPSIKEQLTSRTETIKYEHGSVSVAEYGKANDNHRDVFIIPGFTEGLVALNNFAKELAESGDRRVIFSEQPKSRSFNGLDSIDDQAEAILAIIEHKGLIDSPIDIIAHSMGSLTYARAVELARERGFKCFEPDNGSRVALIAPAGFYEDEGYIKLAKRFTKRAQNFTFGDEALLAKTTTNGKEIGSGGPKSVIRRPVSSAKETYPLAKRKIAKKVGELGIRPHVILYPKDELYGWDIVGIDMGATLENFNGVTMPIGNISTDANSKNKLGEGSAKPDELKAKSHSRASHNDLLFIPERTSRAVIQYFDS